jgi:DNA-binding MarR family transcriptional regulator
VFTVTKRQFDTLKALERFIEINGWAPSVQELSEMIGLTKAGAQLHLDRLETKGIIRRGGGARALKLLVSSDQVELSKKLDKPKTVIMSEEDAHLLKILSARFRRSESLVVSQALKLLAKQVH